MIQSKNKVIVRYVAIFLSVIVMVLIFSFSADNAASSQRKSDSLIEKVASWFIPDFYSLSEEERADFCDIYSEAVRTGAHCSIFALLGFFVSVSVSTFNIQKILSKLIISEIFCVLYALSDEIHQLFSPGRSFQLFDIFCDSCGAFAGIGFAFLIYYLLFGRKRKYNTI